MIIGFLTFFSHSMERMKAVLWIIWQGIDTTVEFISRSIEAFFHYWLITGIMIFILFLLYLGVLF